MKNTTARLQNLLVLALLLFGSQAAFAVAGYATIKKVSGSATYASTAGSGALRTGMTVSAGSRITTAANSFVDIDLGANGNALRIEANSVVTLETLRFRRIGRDATSDTRLRVQRGHVVANVVKKLSRASRYRIETPRGIAGIRGTAFRAGSSGVAVVTGTVEFVPQAGGGVQLVVGGQMFRGAAVEPANNIQTVANVALQTTANTQAANVVSATVTQFATAIASLAATDAAANGGAAAGQSAATTAQQVVTELVTALESAAASAPAEIREQVTQALNSVRTQAATITSNAAAKAAAIGVAKAGGSSNAAQAAAKTAAQQTGQSEAEADKLAQAQAGAIEIIQNGGSPEDAINADAGGAPNSGTPGGPAANAPTTDISEVSPTSPNK